MQRELDKIWKTYERMDNESFWLQYWEDKERFAKWFISEGIYDNYYEVCGCTLDALDIFKKIGTILEYKYDDPDDSPIPSLRPKDPFVLLQSSPINYSKIIERMAEQVKKLPVKKNERRIMLPWEKFYNHATWWNLAKKHSYNWKEYGCELKYENGKEIWKTERIMVEDFQYWTGLLVVD
jgi:hypothetical protein